MGLLNWLLGRAQVAPTAKPRRACVHQPLGLQNPWPDPTQGDTQPGHQSLGRHRMPELPGRTSPTEGTRPDTSGPHPNLPHDELRQWTPPTNTRGRTDQTQTQGLREIHTTNGILQHQGHEALPQPNHMHGSRTGRQPALTQHLTPPRPNPANPPGRRQPRLPDNPTTRQAPPDPRQP